MQWLDSNEEINFRSYNLNNDFTDTEYYRVYFFSNCFVIEDR